MMLQREGSKVCCSWGWGNQLHTKHSKWLHQNLHEVEEKVGRVLAEIEEDGDSFARRAEMYYKKRPQLIAFLHDFHHAYRSLAQRFHHLSVDLHSTSVALASLLPPHHLPFLRPHDHDPDHTTPSVLVLPNSEPASPLALPNSPPVPAGTADRIDSLRKGILEMRAEKEIVKACYEHGLEKYTQIDAMIMDTEKELCGLQEEIDSMPGATLTSFADTLAHLRFEEQHLSEEARAEVHTIKTMLTNFNIHSNLQEEDEDEEKEGMVEVGGGDRMWEMTEEEMEKLVSKAETEVSILREMVRKVQLESKELREKGEMNEGEDIVIKLDTIMELSRKIKEQKNNLRVCFSDAHSNLHGLHHISSIESEKKAIHHFPSLSLDGDSGITTTKITEAADKTGEGGENGDGDDDLTRISSFSFSCRGEDGEKKQSGDSIEGPNWRDLFTRGMEVREKVLLDEYTSVLRSLKEVKSRLGEREEEMQKLRSENTRKEGEIESLTQRVKRLQCCRRTSGGEEEEDIEAVGRGGAAGERLRGRIDEVLEQNLEFWLRFSTSFCRIQRFQKEVEEVEEEATGGGEGRGMRKRLGEEMEAWLGEGAELREELRRRQSSLEVIEGEIRGAVGEEDGEGRRFTAYEGAKLQGEVMNMKQENNKVGEELEAGMEHVSGLHQDVVRIVTVGADETSRKIQHHSWSRARVPIRSFIFGGRFRRQRPSSSSSTINPISIFGLHRKRTPPTPPPLPSTT